MNVSAIARCPADCSGCSPRPAPSARTTRSRRVETPAAFKERAAGRLEARRSRSDAVLRGKWWELFGDPALNALEEQVAVSNQNLAQAEAQFRGARAAVASARAGLFPTVTAGAQATDRTRLAAAAAQLLGHVLVERHGDRLPGADRLLLGGSTCGGGSAATIEANVATAQASAADVENVRLSLQAELAADYFQLHGLDEQKQLLDSTVAAYQKALQLTVQPPRPGRRLGRRRGAGADAARDHAGAGDRPRRRAGPARARHRHPHRQGARPT